MKALGHRSIASILRVALRIFSILLWIALFFAAVAGLALLLVSFGFDLGLEVEQLSPPLALLANAIMFITVGASLIIVGRLRKIFATLAQGDPFVEQNAVHLRVVWIALAVWELSRYLLGGTAAALMYFVPEESTPVEYLNVDISLSVWFSVLTLMVLAEVFREGARLRDEQKLTI